MLIDESLQLLQRLENFGNSLRIGEEEGKKSGVIFHQPKDRVQFSASSRSADKTYAFVDALVIIEVPSFTVSRSLLLNPFYAALINNHQQLPKLNFDDNVNHFCATYLHHQNICGTSTSYNPKGAVHSFLQTSVIAG
jgi:hypothetical protein